MRKTGKRAGRDGAGRGVGLAAAGGRQQAQRLEALPAATEGHCPADFSEAPRGATA